MTKSFRAQSRRNELFPNRQFWLVAPEDHREAKDWHPMPQCVDSAAPVVAFLCGNWWDIFYRSFTNCGYAAFPVNPVYDLTDARRHTAAINTLVALYYHVGLDMPGSGGPDYRDGLVYGYDTGDTIVVSAQYAPWRLRVEKAQTVGGFFVKALCEAMLLADTKQFAKLWSMFSDQILDLNETK